MPLSIAVQGNEDVVGYNNATISWDGNKTDHAASRLGGLLLGGPAPQMTKKPAGDGVMSCLSS